MHPHRTAGLKATRERGSLLSAAPSGPGRQRKPQETTTAQPPPNVRHKFQREQLPRDPTANGGSSDSHASSRPASQAPQLGSRLRVPLPKKHVPKDRRSLATKSRPASESSSGDSSRAPEVRPGFAPQNSHQDARSQGLSTAPSQPGIPVRSVKNPQVAGTSAELLPHLFIHRRDVVPSKQRCREIETIFKPYKPCRVEVDLKTGFFIYFPDTSEGQSNMSESVKELHRKRVFGDQCLVLQRNALRSEAGSRKSTTQRQPGSSSLTVREKLIKRRNGEKNLPREANQPVTSQTPLPKPSSAAPHSVPMNGDVSVRDKDLHKSASPGTPPHAVAGDRAVTVGVVPNSASPQARDDAASLRSETTTSSKSKTTRCHVCRGTGGILWQCNTSKCKRHFHRHCLPEGVAINIHVDTWQCDRCRRKRIPLKRKATEGLFEHRAGPDGTSIVSENRIGKKPRIEAEAVAGATNEALVSSNRDFDKTPQHPVPAETSPPGSVETPQGQNMQEDPRPLEEITNETCPPDLEQNEVVHPGGSPATEPTDFGLKGTEATATENSLDNKSRSSPTELRPSDIDVAQASGPLKFPSTSSITGSTTISDTAQRHPEPIVEDHALAEAEDLVEKSFATADSAPGKECAPSARKKPVWTYVKRQSIVENNAIVGKEEPSEDKSHAPDVAKELAQPCGENSEGRSPMAAQLLNGSTLLATLDSLEDLEDAEDTFPPSVAVPTPIDLSKASAEQHVAPASFLGDRGRDLARPSSTPSDRPSPAPTHVRGPARFRPTKIHTTRCSSCQETKVPSNPHGNTVCMRCKDKAAEQARLAQVEMPIGLPPQATIAAQHSDDSSSLSSFQDTPDPPGPSFDPRSSAHLNQASGASDSSDEIVEQSNAETNDSTIAATSKGNDRAVSATPSAQDDEEQTTGQAVPSNGQKKTVRVCNRSEPIDQYDLGDMHKRPKGTYLRLISMALFALPGNRGIPNQVVDWVVENVPGYDSNQGQWAAGVKSTLIMNSQGTGGRALTKVITVAEASSKERKIYELLPGVVNEVERWDPVLQRPFLPQTNQDALDNEQGEPVLNKSTAKALKPKSIPKHSPERKRRMTASNRTSALPVLKSFIDEPLPSNSPEQQAATSVPKATRQNSVDAMDIDEEFVLPDITAALETDLPQPVDREPSPTTLFGGDYGSAFTKLWKKECRPEFCVKSLFTEWPEYNPKHEDWKNAKISEISRRPKRKALLGKPVRVPALDRADASQSFTPSASVSPAKKIRSTREYIADDGMTIETFHSIDEFFGLSSDLVPAVENKQLVYRHLGTNKRVVYKTGLSV